MPRTNKTLQERFFEKVDHIPNEHGCLLWTASTKGSGYGQIRIEGRIVTAHRVAWVIHNWRPIPRGLDIMHLCEGNYDSDDNTHKRCVNPVHLRAATRKENIQDSHNNNRAQPGPGRGNKALSAEQEKRVVALYASGQHSMSEIAIMFNVSGPIISKTIRERHREVQARRFL